MREQRTVYFSGRVQGVGFRQTTWKIAQSFPVVGWVQNLRDGRVQLVAEGLPADLEAFLAAIAARFPRYIRDTQSTTGPATGTFSDFQVVD